MGPETGPVLEYVASSGDPESVIITESQAVRLVHKYIQQIKVDRFTKLTCVYETAEVKAKQGNMAGYHGIRPGATCPTGQCCHELFKLRSEY